MAKVKVGLVQMTCVKDVAQNMARAIQGIRNAAKDGAQIIFYVFNKQIEKNGYLV